MFDKIRSRLIALLVGNKPVIMNSTFSGDFTISIKPNQIIKGNTFKDSKLTLQSLHDS